MGDVQMLFLFETGSGRRIRIEVPTVFGRHRCFYTYPKENHRRFSPGDAERLQKLDFVEITRDIMISRTHGVLDPTGPVVRDLNSTNGIEVNRQRVARTPGTEGPPHPLRHGDLLRVGNVHFLVELDSAGHQSLCEWLGRDRRAFVAPSDSVEAAQLEVFLRERKRFVTRSATSWSEVARGLSALGHGTSAQLGLVVVALAARPDGDRLRFGGDAVSVGELVASLSELRASKVVALQADGDPAGVEEAFRDLAFQDTVLVTSTVPSHSGVLAPLDNDLVSAPLAAPRRLGPHHAVIDGLDGLIRADSNVLDLNWLARYEGALRVIVGTRLQAPDRELELSYRLPDPTDGTIGSFRVRHQIESRPYRGDVPSSALHGSWRDEPGTT